MKILFIAAQGIGNTLMAVPAIRVLRKKFADSKIDLLTINPVDKLFENCPYINEIYTINKKIHKGFFRNIKIVIELRKKNYDVIITTFPAAQPQFNILAAIIGAKERVTHNYGKNLVFLQNKRIPIQIAHDVEQNLNLLKAMNINLRGSYGQHKLEVWLTKEEKNFAKKFVGKVGRGKIIGIHPGTSVGRRMIEKRWPFKNFAQLIDRLLIKKDLHVLIFLGPADKRLGRIKELVKEKNKGRVTIIKDLDIMKVAAIIGKCNFFVSNDSGLMHLAAAIGIPTAGIFVSTDYRRTAPYGKGHLVLRRGETYKAFRQSIEELSGKSTNWKKSRISQISVEEAFKVIKRKLI